VLKTVVDFLDISYLPALCAVCCVLCAVCCVLCAVHILRAMVAEPMRMVFCLSKRKKKEGFCAFSPLFMERFECGLFC